MFPWGVVLLLMGVLSFVLPAFGRQFILISLLGLAGPGAVGVGILFITVGGGMMFLASQIEKRDEAKERQLEEAGQESRVYATSAAIDAAREFDAKARQMSVETSVRLTMEARKAGKDMLNALRTAVPALYVARAIQLADAVARQREAGLSEEEAVRIVLSAYVAQGVLES